MTINGWPNQRDVATFYGNPDPDGNGQPDRAWEDANLTRITPPWQMVLAWDPKTIVKTITIHKKCAPSLATVLLMIWEHYGRDQAAIQLARLNLFGGSYNFRLMRGSPKLSMHSYGCAIDLDPDNNRFGRIWKDKAGMIPKPAIEAFQQEGWTWGGAWAYPDSMHMQSCTV